jgi:hypothetical protein
MDLSLVSARRFPHEGDPEDPLALERDAAAWHPVDDLPSDGVGDLRTLLVALLPVR